LLNVGRPGLRAGFGMVSMEVSLTRLCCLYKTVWVLI
jgi:hypothetical protein